MDIDRLSDEFWARRPAWVTGGSLSWAGSRFLANTLLESRATLVLEIGTASGFSSALMASVLQAAQAERLITGRFRVVTIDASDRWYVDELRATGEAAQELAPHVIDHITFVNPANSTAVPDYFEVDSIPFLFIDASHAHPWPTLDFLLCLPFLAPDATVVLDDINLPLIRPEFPDWGAHHLYYGVDLVKEEGAVDSSGVASMGKLRVPNQKAELAKDLIRILETKEWQRVVPQDVVERARSVAISVSG